MAEEPNIVLTNTPSKYNLSFGKNVFSFNDTNDTGAKVGVQIWKNLAYPNFLTQVKVAEVQQYPNPVGYYHFDIQNILQNYTIPNYDGDSLAGLEGALVESFNFKIKYGYINAVGEFNLQGTLPGTGNTNNYVVFGGRKRYDQLTWDYDPYTWRLETIAPGCPYITKRSKALTDWTITKPISLLSGGKPEYITGGTISPQLTEIYNMKMRYKDDFVLTFFNVVDSTSDINDQAKTIKAFIIHVYNGNTLQGTIIEENLLYNGGGPNQLLNGTLLPFYPFDAINVQVVKRNISIMDENTTHIYVAAFTSRVQAGCPSFNNDDVYFKHSISYPYRIDIVPDACNDFTPVQVSWLNSFGFRDYFSFRKRTDESVDIVKNTYERVEGSWASQTFSVNTYERGAQVYSQDLTIRKSINTDYLSDAEAQFLKNLFISPDVRVRYNNDTEWIPIVVEDSSWTEKTFRKDKFFQYTLNYTEAHKIQSQRG